LQIAKSRGKGAPKKKRTAAGKSARGTHVTGSRHTLLTVGTQRARSSTARRGNDRILGIGTSIHCTEFRDTVYRSWGCTVWPRGCHDYERGQLRPPMRRVCMYNILFTLSNTSVWLFASATRQLEYLCDIGALRRAVRKFTSASGRAVFRAHLGSFSRNLWFADLSCRAEEGSSDSSADSSPMLYNVQNNHQVHAFRARWNRACFDSMHHILLKRLHVRALCTHDRPECAVLLDRCQSNEQWAGGDTQGG
jgi:hypothetical protein